MANLKRRKRSCFELLLQGRVNALDQPRKLLVAVLADGLALHIFGHACDAVSNHFQDGCVLRDYVISDGMRDENFPRLSPLW
jgi:hypothetical protein